MGKVRIGDIVKVKAGVDAKTRTSAFNRIQSKHIDFVACDPEDLSVQFVIELDDSSHSKQDRQDRDAFVDKVMGAAGIPIIHFPVKRTYSIQEVRDTLVSKLNQPEASPVPAPKVSSAPTTPKATPKFASVAVPTPIPAPATIDKPSPVSAPPEANEPPSCPSCGVSMVRRKSSKGANAGNEFWGCSSYPKCRGIVAIG